MTNREKIIRINEIAVRCINAGPISLETGIENIREIVNGDTLDELREEILKLRDALLLARDVLDRMMGNTNRPATAAEAVAILFEANDYGLPNTRGLLEAMLKRVRDNATRREDALRRPAKDLTVRDIADIGAQLEDLRALEKRIELKLRVVELVERLYE